VVRNGSFDNLLQRLCEDLTRLELEENGIIRRLDLMCEKLNVTEFRSCQLVERVGERGLYKILRLNLHARLTTSEYISEIIEGVVFFVKAEFCEKESCIRKVGLMLRW